MRSSSTVRSPPPPGHDRGHGERLGWVPGERPAVGSRHLRLEMAAETVLGGSGRWWRRPAICRDMSTVSPPSVPPEDPGRPEARSARCRERRGVLLLLCRQPRPSRAGRSGDCLLLADDRPAPGSGRSTSGAAELHAEALAASRCREDVRQAAGDGMPVSASAGALYLRTAHDATDGDYPMAGVLRRRQ